MEDVIFLVEETPEAGYLAKGLGVSIYTQAETIPALHDAVIDAVQCHFDDGKKNSWIFILHGRLMQRIK